MAAPSALKGLIFIIYLDLLLPLAVMFNIYLYFYPLLYSCKFPSPAEGQAADLRLLILADPQLEGDTALRPYSRPRKNSTELGALSIHDRLDYEMSYAEMCAHYYRKQLDLWGNDVYLAHIFKRVRKLTAPSHLAVVGDLLGSQWIPDEEFNRRGERFWDIFANTTKVTAGDVALKDADSEDWRQKLIALPGNHDVGYAGDMSPKRLQRFEDMFGPFNYDLVFHALPNENYTDAPLPELRLAIVNSMSLDKPIYYPELAVDSYAFLEKLAEKRVDSGAQATVLLSHLPLWKAEGVCTDAPYMAYFPEENGSGIKTQNMLTRDTSRAVVESVFGLPAQGTGLGARRGGGVVVSGHDHEGCDIVHSWNASAVLNDSEESDATSSEEKLGAWDAMRVKEYRNVTGQRSTRVLNTPDNSFREVTVRSMMGDYGGNIGMLSAWFDWDEKLWRFGYSFCSLGVAHLWWATQVINTLCFFWGGVLAIMHARDKWRNEEKARVMQEELEKKDQ